MEAFYECSSLQKLSLPATEVIDMYAFAECSGLTELALPKIKSIGYCAFSGCPNIWKVSFGRGHTEEQMITLSETIFGTGTRAGGEANASFPENLELELGENVLPKPAGNTWNGYTWKKVTVVPAGTGIEEVTAANALNVYPNPVTDRLHIECRDAMHCVSTEYIIYNSMGQAVMQGKLQGEISTLHVESLPKGIYYLNIAEQTVKFVKK